MFKVYIKSWIIQKMIMKLIHFEPSSSIDSSIIGDSCQGSEKEKTRFHLRVAKCSN